MSKKKYLCPDCSVDRHANPPFGSFTCQCSDRRCACYGMQMRMGVRQETMSQGDTSEQRDAYLVKSLRETAASIVDLSTREGREVAEAADRLGALREQLAAAESTARIEAQLANEEHERAEVAVGRLEKAQAALEEG